MADERGQSNGETTGETVLDEKGRTVPPWAQGRTLRTVERDVLIPRIMREKAKVKCKDLVDDFKQCATGRTLSMVWKCMDQNKAMKKCLATCYKDSDFYEECKEIYLENRDQFQKVWVETGKTKMPKRKDSEMF